MTKSQKIQNERFLKTIILTKASWFYPDACEMYKVTEDDKIQPFSMRGYQILMEIVRQEFFEQYVIAPVQ